MAGRGEYRNSPTKSLSSRGAQRRGDLYDMLPLNETAWLLDLSTNFPHALGEALADLLESGESLSVMKVDGLPYFYPASQPLAVWVERRHSLKGG